MLIAEMRLYRLFLINITKERKIWQNQKLKGWKSQCLTPCMKLIREKEPLKKIQEKRNYLIFPGRQPIVKCVNILVTCSMNSRETKSQKRLKKQRR